MNDEPKRPCWWGPRSGMLLALGFGVAAAAPFVVNGAKAYAAEGKVDVAEVVKETKEEKEKKEREHGPSAREMKSAVLLPDGTVYAGGKGGLAVRKGTEWSIVKDFPQDEVKTLALGQDGTLWATGKKGLYSLKKDGAWTTVKEGDMHSVNVAADGSILAVGKKGFYTRSAAGEWSEAPALLPEGMKAPEEEKEKEKEKEKKEKEEKH